VYWSDVDHNAHLYGPEDERGEAEFALFSIAMEKFFLERLSPQVRRNTVLCLAADHGMIHTRKDPHYELKNHPSLTRRLHMMPSGENRLAYFFIRPGQVEAVREYIERTWPNQFSIIDPVYAAQTGLFGSGEMHPRLYERLGDLMLVARGDAYLWWHEKDNFLIGRHGGLHPEEMLVPFVGVSLDAL
jgi:predicted AlkP superfamily pyrophosphatase or phosphodiesterase